MQSGMQWIPCRLMTVLYIVVTWQRSRDRVLVTSGAGEGRAARSPRDQHGSGVRDCQRQSGSERSGQCGVLLDPQIRVSAAHVTPSTLQLDDEIISYYSSWNRPACSCSSIPGRRWTTSRMGITLPSDRRPRTLYIYNDVDNQSYWYCSASLSRDFRRISPETLLTGSGASSMPSVQVLIRWTQVDGQDAVYWCKQNHRQRNAAIAFL